MMNDIDCDGDNDEWFDCDDDDDDGLDDDDDAGGMGDGAQGANDWDGDQKYVA